MGACNIDWAAHRLRVRSHRFGSSGDPAPNQRVAQFLRRGRRTPSDPRYAGQRVMQGGSPGGLREVFSRKPGGYRASHKKRLPRREKSRTGAVRCSCAWQSQGPLNGRQPPRIGSQVFLDLGYTRAPSTPGTQEHAAHGYRARPKVFPEPGTEDRDT